MSLDLDDVLEPDTTTMQVVDEDNPDQPTGCFISGYTIGSDGWLAAQRKVVGPPKATSLIIEKKRQRIEIPPVAPDQELKVLAHALTDIEGLTIKGKPFKFSTENAVDLFTRAGFRKVVQQWRDHLNGESDFTPSPETKPASTPEASAG